jgi:hypothetical protein
VNTPKPKGGACGSLDLAEEGAKKNVDSGMYSSTVVSVALDLAMSIGETFGGSTGVTEAEDVARVSDWGGRKYGVEECTKRRISGESLVDSRRC